jgi:hypothetical protein
LRATRFHVPWRCSRDARFRQRAGISHDLRQTPTWDEQQTPGGRRSDAAPLLRS